MCRYAMTAYKPHYACFTCRKTYKRRLISDIKRGAISEADATCPQCGNLLADMGKDFEAPRTSDKKAWGHLRALYTAGITYHSCGCSGPGYIPATKDALITYFEEHIEEARTQLTAWRAVSAKGKGHKNETGAARAFELALRVPADLRTEGININTTEAIDFWIKRIRELEAKIKAAAQVPT